jgi:vitamin B12 transporter
MRVHLIAAASALALPAAAAQAQTPAARGDEVVVTANRIPTLAEQVGGSVTVITASEIERRQLRTVVDILQTVPGLNAPQLGGFGAQTSVFTRGGNSNQTLILIDGIEASDPSNANGAFDFGHLLATDIERIEVLRGPAAGIYGSTAIGGVVNIITKTGRGKPGGYAEVEGGSHGTFNQRAGASAGGERWDFSAALQHLKTDGESATAARFAVPGFERDPDGYENWTASFKGSILPTDNTKLSLVVRHTQSELDLDVTREDPDSHSEQRSTFMRVEGSGSFFNDVWTPTIGAAYTKHDRKLRNDPDRVEQTVNADPLQATLQRTDDTGRRYKVDWRNDLKFVPWNVLSVGVERRRDELDEATSSRFDSGFGPFIIAGNTSVSQDINTFYVQDRVELFDSLFVTGDVRRDDVDSLEAEYTWRLSLAYLYRPTGTRIKGAIGTGFRAPALFELFGFTANNFGGTFRGNPNLDAEHSRGFEAGFDQSLWDKRVSFGATYFRSQVNNLIVCSITTCNNVARAEIYGVESFAAFSVTKDINLRVDHTYIQAENVATGGELQRRPRHKAGLTAGWSPLEGASLNAGLFFISRFADAGFNGGTTHTGGYTVVNVSGAYDITPMFGVFGRIDNIFDRDYQVADGFAGRGRAGIVGVRAQF